MAYLGNTPASRFTSMDKQTITGDGGTGYTLDHAVGSEQEIEVFVNNVRQEPSVAYTVAGTALTMTGNVASTDDFYVVFQGKAQQSVTHPSSSALQATTGTFSSNVDINGNELILDADGDTKISASTDDVMTFDTAGSEAARLDSSGNLLVGKTSSDSGATAGVELKSDGNVRITKDGGSVTAFNRLTSNGTIVTLQKDGVTVGSIGCENDELTIDSKSGNTGISFRGSHLRPRDNGADIDNGIDLGVSSFRFDDIFATNGTIQTSDANEKQQIASLTDAEMTAAKAISALFKTFKWKDKVAAKGDAARTHTGVIAQDVEAAMTDAGLDAGDYAFFISDTWTDDDGNSQTRKGIRYPELLSFVGAATEQRLADIETRLAALENA